MKHLLIITQLFLLSLVVHSQVYISGEVKNAPGDSLVSVSYCNNPIEWKQLTAATAKLDEGGRFTLVFDFIKPGLADLHVASQFTRLFLSPKDSLFISVDYKNFDASLHYSGRGAANNNYLAAELLEDFNYKAYKSGGFNDADKVKIYIDSLENESKKFFIAHDNPEFSAAFREYISITNKYCFINPRWMFRIIFDRETRDYKNRDLPKSYFDFLDKIDLNDQPAAENPAYSTALQRVLDEKGIAGGRSDSAYFYHDLQTMEKDILQDYELRKQLFKDKVLDYQLTDFMKQTIQYLQGDPGFLENLLKKYRSDCRNPDYLGIIDKIYAQSLKVLPGSPAPDFTLTNADGKKVTLSSFKGKTVCLDFWSARCAPCLVAMPRMHELVEKFMDKPDVIFVFVNMKDPLENWKQVSVKQKINGINLHADLDEAEVLLTSFNFSGIPHYILIDKDGNFINPNVESPDRLEKAILD